MQEADRLKQESMEEIVQLKAQLKRYEEEIKQVHMDMIQSFVRVLYQIKHF